MTVEHLEHISSQQLEEIYQQMLKFALLQLKDPFQAEDAVQEALASAYKNANAFKGQAALKTWIFAILKNKIIDLVHSNKRTVNVSELYEDETETVNHFFDQAGSWQENNVVSEFNDVAQMSYQKEFWAIFDLCLNKLPGQQARVFMMREHLEFSTDEICAECNISISNLHVLLHRARLQLQSCLSKNWFEGDNHEL